MSEILTPDIIKVKIQQKKAEVKELEDLLILTKKYGPVSLNGHGLKKARLKAYRKSVKAPSKLGISQFILNMLTKGETETKDIVSAWAAKVGKPEDKVYNGVSNALQRLKSPDLNKIDNRMNEGGKRFGAIWFLKK